MTSPTETIDYLVQRLLAGAADALSADIDAYFQGRDATPDELSVAGFAALATDRPLAARAIVTAACVARSSASPEADPASIMTLEDATVVAWHPASVARFSSATDVLRDSLRFRAASSALFPLTAAMRFDILIRATTQADIPVWDASTQRLLTPEDVRRDATEQVRAELAMCIERCAGTPEAPRMARELVRLGMQCGNTSGNWGHVFATVARMIDAAVDGADSLLLT